MEYISDIAFSDAVKKVQETQGSRTAYARMETAGGWRSEVDTELSDFLSTQDSFYLATANAKGQPYVQHRGGPQGFLKPIGNDQLAFADFSGNRQYISVGNLSENVQAFIFLMDYARQTRIKIWGTAQVVTEDPGLLQKLVDPEYHAIPERIIMFTVKAWDVNCRQHIKQRYTAEQLKQITQPLKDRIAELEAQLGK
jgi:predicted pyridoxine 5'-phosphate oxidase superfamily flavin-nucleotide-binding protein